MNPKSYNKWMVRAISRVGDAGYKVSKIAISEASWKNGKLDFALFSVTAGVYGEIYEMTVSVWKEGAVIGDKKQVH